MCVVHRSRAGAGPWAGEVPPLTRPPRLSASPSAGRRVYCGRPYLATSASVCPRAGPQAPASVGPAHPRLFARPIPGADRSSPSASSPPRPHGARAAQPRRRPALPRPVACGHPGLPASAAAARGASTDGAEYPVDVGMEAGRRRRCARTDCARPLVRGRDDADAGCSPAFDDGTAPPSRWRSRSVDGRPRRGPDCNAAKAKPRCVPADSMRLDLRARGSLAYRRQVMRAGRPVASPMRRLPPAATRSSCGCTHRH